MLKQILFIVILLQFNFLLIESQNATKPSIDFDFSLGTVFPGKIQAAWYSDFKPNETFTFHNAQCLLIKGSADYNFMKNVSLGICMNYVPIHIQDVASLDISDQTIHMCEIDGTIKYRFAITKEVVIKPGIVLGYRRTFSQEPDARESGFCLNAGIECLYYIKKNYFLLGDFGFFTQPYGGVKDVVYVRAWPVLYGSIGIGISL